MTNPSQHSSKSTPNIYLPHGINIRLIEAQGMRWIGGVVCNVTGYAVREFQDPGCHETVNVI